MIRVGDAKHWTNPAGLSALAAERIRAVRPDVVTAVHCETPSGTLTPDLALIGAACRETGALFIVDFVSSAFGAPLRVSEWGIDLGLCGSQKVLSCPPDLSMITVTPRAWDRVRQVGYVGYDALLPFAPGASYDSSSFPYTQNWNALRMLALRLQSYADEGFERVIERHQAAAAVCRRRARELGLRLYAESDAVASPTVTAVHVPDGWTWAQLDAALRRRGVLLAGSYGPLANKVFRVGHMGTQAELSMVERAMTALAEVLKEGPAAPSSAS